MEIDMQEYKFTYEVVIVEEDEEAGIEEKVVTIVEKAEVDGDLMALIEVLNEQSDVVNILSVEEI